MGLPSPAGAVAGYGDVGEGTWYTDAVQWSTDNGITDIAGPCFGPDTPVSRGETAVWIYNMENPPDNRVQGDYPTTGPATGDDDGVGDRHSFTDVTDASQDDAISWMANTGITTGKSPTTFAPDDTLTRAEAAAFLHRLEGEPAAPPHSFVDVVTAWQQGGVSWMADTGITTGKSPTTFAPEDTLTRAHLVTFLYRYQNEPDVTVNTTTPTCDPAQTVVQYTIGDTIAGFPSGIAAASGNFSGASVSITDSGSTVTVEINDGGSAAYTGAIYTCTSAGGCTIVNGRVTNGTVNATTSTATIGGEDGDDMDEMSSTPGEGTTITMARAGGELIIALTTQPNALDGANAAERNAGNVSNQIFDPLVWINDDLEFEPALAESWTVSDDGLTYTFKLREDVVFHNGEPFNADSVVFSWEVQKQPENAYFNYYERAAEVNKIDEFTVELVAPEPNALFLGLTAAIWFFVPPEYYAEVGLTGFGQAPVGTGPFMLTEWVQGDRIVLDRNPNYWREGFPKLDRIIFRPITESSTRASAIQTGEVDIVNRLSPDDAASLDGIDGVNVIDYPTNRVYYIAFNNLTSGVGEPTEDPLVRQALNYAVDVEGIIGALFNGKGVRATGLMTAADFGYNDQLVPYPYDPERARELLAEAGFADGFDIGFACPSGAYTNFVQVCEAVAAQLREVGVNAPSLEIMDSGAYWDLESKKQLPPLFGDSWSNPNPEGWHRLKGAMGGNAASFSAWSDPVVDRLLVEILATPDDDARADLYRQLQQQMYDDPPFIYLYVPFSFEAISDRVANYKPRSAEEYWLWDLAVAG